MTTLICSVQATHNLNKGWLSILQVSDVHYLVEFKFQVPHHGSDIVFDFDDASLVPNDHEVHRNESPLEKLRSTPLTFPMIFLIQDIGEWGLLEDAFFECRTLASSTLRMGLLMRDIYFAGVFSAINPDSCDTTESTFTFQDDLQDLHEKNTIDDVTSFGLSAKIVGKRASTLGSVAKQQQLLATSTSNTTNANVKAAGASNSSTKGESVDKAKRESVLEKIVCIYCNVAMLSDNTRDFVLHPYVPQTYKKEPMYMCMICVNSWKEYRDKVDIEDGLVLEGEVNEELCAVCSDTPAILIMCGKCPRSYCDSCLKKVLSEKQYGALKSQDDWACMCCTPQASAMNAPLPRALWKVLRYNDLMSLSSSAMGNAKQDLQKQKMLANTAFSAAKPVRPFESTGTNPATLSVNSSTSSSSTSSSTRLMMESPLLAAVPPSLKKPATANDSLIQASASNVGGVFTSASGRSSKRPVFSEYLNLDDPAVYHEAMRRATSKKVASNLNIAMNSSEKQVAITKVDDKHTPRQHQQQEALVSGGKGVKRGSLPPVNNALDEAFYFSQYVQFYSGLCQQCESNPKWRPPTDDFCFLCKDGGDLIQCDHVDKSTRRKCRKVYHDYCLDYDVPNRDLWCCPRHYCDVCGSLDIRYICLYCPISICQKCPVEMVRKYAHVDYIVLDHPATMEFGSDAVPIVCHTCVQMVRKCNNRKDLADPILKSLLSRPIKKFSGAKQGSQPQVVQPIQVLPPPLPTAGSSSSGKHSSPIPVPAPNRQGKRSR